MKTTKQYSVLMSVYKNEQPNQLARSIDSVFSQTILPNDFVIVCDGPLTDDLNQVLTEKQSIYKNINVVRKDKNEGLGLALAHGLGFVKNDLVMRMDSDDICLYDRAESQLPMMDEYDLVGGLVTEFDGDESNITGKRLVPEHYGDIKKFAKYRCPFNHPTVMFNKKLIESVGGYEHFPFFEDYCLWVRVLNKTDKVYNLQKVLVNMRSGRKMRSRRGGKEYRKSHRLLRKKMYQMHFISWINYVLVTPLRNLVFALPVSFREKIYKMFLRKSRKES